VAREEQRAVAVWQEFQTSAGDKTQEAYAWLARLEAKGISKDHAVKPEKWRR